MGRKAGALLPADSSDENFTFSNSAPNPSATGAPEILHADLTGAPTLFEAATDAWVARQRAALNEGQAEGRPAPATPPGGPSEAAAAALILKNGTFDTSLEEAPYRDFHRDPWHGVDVLQSQIWDFPRPGLAESCGAPYRGVQACPAKVSVVRDHCDVLECAHPYCERRNRDRRAGAIFDRLQLARRGRPVIYQVFTLPPSRREEAAKDKTWRRWLRNLLAYLKKDFDLEFAAERSDPCGEDGERWHPHINLAWIRRSGKGFFQPEELLAIKARWKKIVGLKPTDPVSVYTSFTRKDAKIMHIARYLGRCWPRWAKSQKYLLRVKWFGKPPKVEKPKGPKLCKCCGAEEVYLALGSQEAAEAMAARGYEAILLEAEDRRAHFRRMAPAKFQKYTVRVGPGGQEWIPERR